MKRFLLLNIYLLIGGLLLFNKAGYAFQPVKYLGIEQGLSNNSATCIFKDHYGFVWIGSYDGLNRYDGSTVKIFRNIWGDDRSLNDNHVNNITGTGSKIFVGTLRGLVYYDYNNSRFSPLFYHSTKTDHPRKIANNITALQTDAKENLYVGTDYAGLFTYHNGDKTGRQIALGTANRTYCVQAITVDNANTVWLFVRNVGLCRFNRQKNTIQVLNTELSSANCLLKAGANKIIIGTDNGLYTYNSLTGGLSGFLNKESRLTSGNITDMKFSRSGDLWVATNGGGVNILDTLLCKVKYVISGKENYSTLHSDAVSMLYQDSQERMWITTLRGGVNIVDNQRSQFKLISHNPFNKNSVINNFSLSFCEDEKNNLWIGTDGGGLSYWNRKTDQYTNYKHVDGANSLNSNFVVSVVKDASNQIWIALFEGGIDRYDKRSGRFIHYDLYNPATRKTDRNLWKLYVDSHNNIWAGTTRGGAMYRYNKSADKFEIFDERLINIHAIFEDHNGTLWAGDYSRLIKIDPDRNRYTFLNVKNAVRSVTEDNYHNLWIGTEGGGLIKYNPENDKLTRLTQINGLPSNSVLNVLADNSNHLWASTYNGLTEYNIATGEFRNFDVSDGLQSNQFNFNAALKLKSGELVFGGINGFNIFYPDSIKLPVHEPLLRINGLQISNKNVEGNSRYTPKQTIVDLKRIIVPYDEATITVNYTVLEYSFPDKINYAYYLEGWDHGWNNVGKLKTAYYTRLNEGEYTLRIKATNTLGKWNTHQLVIAITVLPPWYRTWWAYILYAGVAVVVVYWFWRYRIRQTKLRYEVQIANLQVEREKDLNEKKLSFFTNVSHEFRTPLTLIINPIKDLLRNGETQDKEELNTIYRNARRLLVLVDHLLLFRKTESEIDALNLSRIDFSALCNEVYLCFIHQAKIKNIKYDLYCANPHIIINADREKMEIVIFNLISNALKFTPQGGEIQIRLYETDAQVFLEVTDNGCGIAAGTGEKLFDKFYQVKNNAAPKKGFGIGLYLVKSFAESHDGKVNYKNNLQGGTTFTIELPKKELPPLNEFLETEEDNYRIDELANDEAASGLKVTEDSVSNLELLISDRQSVLIIDDNAQLRGYIRKIFKDAYKIYEAETGELGLELIKKYLPDVVISDITMSGLSGIELCRLIKQDTSLSHIPVILLTGDTNPEIKLKGIEVGAVDFVGKPFEKDLLLARVQGILKDRRELQNYFFNEVTLKSDRRDISEHHKDFIYKCISIIENNLGDPEFDVKTISDEMGMSYSSLFKKIKAVSGQSVNSFVRFVRLRKAAEIMIHTNCNVNEAALNTGFNDVKYFREHFIKQFGIKPSEFIKKHRTAFHKTYRVEETSFH